MSIAIQSLLYIIYDYIVRYIIIDYRQLLISISVLYIMIDRLA